MDFDVKTFFAKTFRVSSEARIFSKTLAENVVASIVSVCTLMTDENINLQHVEFALYQICVDPIVMYTRHGLCIQNSKFKCVTRTLIKNLEACDEDDKYAQVDKKFFKSCVNYIKKLSDRKFASKALRAIACFAAQICGIVLNAASEKLESGTLNVECIEQHGTFHSIDDERFVNSSLVRNLYFVQKGHWVQTERHEAMQSKHNGTSKTNNTPTEKSKESIFLAEKLKEKPTNKTEKSKDTEKSTKTEKSKETTGKTREKLESDIKTQSNSNPDHIQMKRVDKANTNRREDKEESARKTQKISKVKSHPPRPRTPDHCFWEDDE